MAISCSGPGGQLGEVLGANTLEFLKSWHLSCAEGSIGADRDVPVVNLQKNTDWMDSMERALSLTQAGPTIRMLVWLTVAPPQATLSLREGLLDICSTTAHEGREDLMDWSKWTRVNLSTANKPTKEAFKNDFLNYNAIIQKWHDDLLGRVRKITKSPVSLAKAMSHRFRR
ncbi:hypothetical protein Pmar_PMAR001637 [Perkinsus marinus ATCC 50983]|uniref:Uncharacterized protein n=1 Tax=Perkinsus marinus (strain ATCC 50983 / TXsc) TaxID=423536 RepID=C5K687_PERM5|nr:hypothetical protein Pmar_PMAR001637 [Perkinsus marinus ATCC 50983]EER20015.1 hypothetical protein Pmar_PMAR001637 [Perkinsus marinus ATCC 50983]|eukprot:XP_002788219.1 hypothetical protein Pmar_PMAR001637 [Perkinsus marinus ATCC 50983]